MHHKATLLTFGTVVINFFALKSFTRLVVKGKEGHPQDYLCSSISHQKDFLKKSNLSQLVLKQKSL